MRKGLVVFATSVGLVALGFFAEVVAGVMTSREGFLGGLVLLCAMVGFLVWVVPAWFGIVRRAFHSAVVAAALLLLAGACTRIDPGHVGIKVDNAGGQRGVQDLAVSTGWVFYLPGYSTVYEFPIDVQTIVWSASAHEGKPVDESITFASKGGTQFSADVSASFAIDSTNAPKFFVKFRNDNVDGFKHGYFRNITRDALNETSALMSPDEIMSERLTELIVKTRERLVRETESVGVRLVQFGFIGAPRPPSDIAAAINAKNRAVQDAVRVENELRVERAEAAKVVAKAEGVARKILVETEAQAQANEKLARSISPALVQYEAVKKWDGRRPTVEGAGGGVLLNLPVPAK